MSSPQRGLDHQAVRSQGVAKRRKKRYLRGASFVPKAFLALPPKAGLFSSRVKLGERFQPAVRLTFAEAHTAGGETELSRELGIVLSQPLERANG